LTPRLESGGAGESWIGIPLYGRADEEMSFLGTSYPVRMRAVGKALVWSVPEGSPQASGGKSSFESGLLRFAVTSTVEAWCFPKLEREKKHEIVMFIDRQNGTAASLEIMLNPAKSGQRPAITVLRGALLGNTAAYGGFAFPRHRPVGRRVSFGHDAASAFIDFDRSGQPSAIGRANATSRASGHALRVAPDVWAAVWRTADSAGITLCDERGGIVNGATVTSGHEQTMSFGIRSKLRWSV
jgi:hypothetical protein